MSFGVRLVNLCMAASGRDMGRDMGEPQYWLWHHVIFRKKNRSDIDCSRNSLQLNSKATEF